MTVRPRDASKVNAPDDAITGAPSFNIETRFYSDTALDQVFGPTYEKNALRKQDIVMRCYWGFFHRPAQCRCLRSNEIPPPQISNDGRRGPLRPSTSAFLQKKAAMDPHGQLYVRAPSTLPGSPSAPMPSCPWRWYPKVYTRPPAEPKDSHDVKGRC